MYILLKIETEREHVGIRLIFKTIPRVRNCHVPILQMKKRGTGWLRKLPQVPQTGLQLLQSGCKAGGISHSSSLE